jgi:hypothetical protein
VRADTIRSDHPLVMKGPHTTLVGRTLML